MSDQKLSANEGIKASSHGLRGTIADGLQRQITGSLADDDTQLTKFHGIYQQDVTCAPSAAVSGWRRRSASWRGCASRPAS
jgi:sulfite reductase beta subunit-like hemoprotein